MLCSICVYLPLIFGIFLISWIYKKFTQSNLLKRLENKTVLITGGSSGIGLSLACLAWENGAKIIISGRNKTKLDDALVTVKSKRGLSSSEIEAIQLDVTSDYMDIDKKLIPYRGKIDVLINCAGAAATGEFCESPARDIEAQIRLNYLGSAHVTRALLPSMKEDKSGFKSVVFVSSMLGQFGLYGMAAYSASKFALRGLAESLKLELSGSNIGVTLVFPADTDTPGLENENIGKPDITKELCATSGLLQPETVARSIYEACLTKTFFCYLGIDGWLLTQVTHGMVLPHNLRDFISLVFLSGIYRIVAFVIAIWIRYVIRKNQ